jgi:predicted nucleic acid-binding protein
VKTPFRIYVDTSVFGGCFDQEFAEHSRRFFALAANGRVHVLISEVVVAELSGAPEDVQEVLKGLPARVIEAVDLTPEVIALRDAYIQADIVGPKWRDDATHVAAATCARADAIVSWNFKHIVRLDKMRSYNAVNLQAGYGLLSIVSPQEVRFDEADQQ